MRVRGASRLEHLSPGSRLSAAERHAGETHAEGAYVPVSFVTFTSTAIPRKLEALPE